MSPAVEGMLWFKRVCGGCLKAACYGLAAIACCDDELLIC